MSESLIEKIYHAHQAPKQVPGIKEVEEFTSDLLKFLFPELNEIRFISYLETSTQFNQLRIKFEELLYQNKACDPSRTASVCQLFFQHLEDIYDKCLCDATAITSGDPAAVNRQEVIRAYPGFFAIAVYRIAHMMLLLDIPYLPRIMSEYAHGKTGVDIHPGAEIGEHFCIDHGTGVVIGETTKIGDYVKIYQGVTLGALSVKKTLARKKRHPTIEDHVVLYSGATILGGDTVIGANSIIGGNTWIVNSVPPNSRVQYNKEDIYFIND